MISENGAPAPRLPGHGHRALRAFARGLTALLPLCALALSGCDSDNKRIRERTYLATMHADLRSLRNRQEAHFVDSARYAGHMDQLGAYGPASASHVTILEGSATGWAARATHDSLPGRSCVVGFWLTGSSPAKAIATDEKGMTAPPDGQVVCDTIP